ncbi:hypothetical protein PtA15_16A351 [Puccinia triticina]|uniref:Uncharacterized protein n=1 Tax=Puccinia triticina TaxID=208348 RepID=A0ABY7D768_9BASI|nr:uncharacterized protein PtA15_16A351 [Puccinia triticina]WAQ92443.1 hypothetical protein PtA15_16A351 [Puccinia triticina]
MSPTTAVVLGEPHQLPKTDQVLFCGDFMTIAKPVISINVETGATERFVRTIQKGLGLHMPGGGIYGVDLHANRATLPFIKGNMTYTISGNIAPYTGQIVPN